MDIESLSWSNRPGLNSDKRGRGHGLVTWNLWHGHPSLSVANAVTMTIGPSFQSSYIDLPLPPAVRKLNKLYILLLERNIIFYANQRDAQKRGTHTEEVQKVHRHFRLQYTISKKHFYLSWELFLLRKSLFLLRKNL